MENLAPSVESRTHTGCVLTRIREDAREDVYIDASSVNPALACFDTSVARAVIILSRSAN